nr:YadA-like family protein [Trinickia acidisoli]
MPPPYEPGQSGISVGGGTYIGQSALAIGISHISESGRMVFRASASMTTGGTVGAGAGATWTWK